MIGILACLAFAALVAGCAAWGQPDAATIVRDNKNAAVVCSSIVGPWGTSKLVVLNQDAGVIKDGGVSVDANCLVTTTSATPPRAATK